MARTKQGNPRPKTPPLHSNTRWEHETKYPKSTTTTSSTSASSTYGKICLADLPEELLLLIVSKLLAIRLDQPQSQAFRNKERETDRQYENYYRRVALYSVCLTSKKLNRLAVPALYNAITGSTTRYGITPLRLFWKTLTEKEELRPHVEYVENLLSDCLGNSLVSDVMEADDTDGAEGLVNEYFEKLAGIMRICPNIEQMSVISIESLNFSLWQHLLANTEVPDISPTGQEIIVSRHWLSGLRKLAFQTNCKEDYVPFGRIFPCFQTILFALRGCSSLTELRAFGVTSGYFLDIKTMEPFKNLQRLEIMECSIGHEGANEALMLCKNLRHFICHWSFLYMALSNRSMDLLPALARHYQTLETLWLVTPTAGYDAIDNTNVTCSSLREMSAIKEAKLCNVFIPDRRCRGSVTSSTFLPSTDPPIPIAPELPPQLEHLTISYTMQYADLTTWRIYVLRSLYELALNCAQYLPRLREVVVQYEGGRVGSLDAQNEALVRAFKRNGIRFSIFEELELLATLS